jgi:hypothetical protein
MKFSHEYQRSSLLDHQDGWHITHKQEEQLITMPLENKDNQGGN